MSGRLASCCLVPGQRALVTEDLPSLPGDAVSWQGTEPLLGITALSFCRATGAPQLARRRRFLPQHTYLGLVVL